MIPGIGRPKNYELNKRFLELWLIEKLSNKEIAERLGKSRKWIKGIKQRLKYKDIERIYGIAKGANNVQRKGRTQQTDNSALQSGEK